MICIKSVSDILKSDEYLIFLDREDLVFDRSGWNNVEIEFLLDLFSVFRYFNILVDLIASPIICEEILKWLVDCQL